MKKVAALLLIICTIFGLCGCGSGVKRNIEDGTYVFEKATYKKFLKIDVSKPKKDYAKDVSQTTFTISTVPEAYVERKSGFLETKPKPKDTDDYLFEDCMIEFVFTVNKKKYNKSITLPADGKIENQEITIDIPSTREISSSYKIKSMSGCVVAPKEDNIEKDINGMPIIYGYWDWKKKVPSKAALHSYQYELTTSGLWEEHRFSLKRTSSTKAIVYHGRTDFKGIDYGMGFYRMSADDELRVIAIKDLEIIEFNSDNLSAMQSWSLPDKGITFYICCTNEGFIKALGELEGVSAVYSFDELPEKYK